MNQTEVALGNGNEQNHLMFVGPHHSTECERQDECFVNEGLLYQPQLRTEMARAVNSVKSVHMGIKLLQMHFWRRYEAVQLESEKSLWPAPVLRTG